MGWSAPVAHPLRRRMTPPPPPKTGEGSRNLDVFPEADPVVDRLHLGLRRQIGPGRARAGLAVLDDIVELHAVRAFEIARRLGCGLEQVHLDRVAREIDVAADLERLV